MTDFREFQDGEVVPGTRYRITRLIGTGGMGRVYEVEHVELGKRFVLKALQRELARREDLVARLRNEWRALAQLEHPNIVSVTDAGTSENGVPFYVMERLEGETLAALLHRSRRLLPQQALAISAGILEGLHAAHQIGVVHRDVKPPNIFLTGPTSVKVLDFGIAKIRDAKNVITARGMAVGTPRYMSPEQASGASVDARSDIYATGLMLFEMVTGVGPFDDVRDANELLLAHLGRHAPLLSSISVVAPELDALVAAMLAKDPRERPRDARQVAEQLGALSLRYERAVATDVPTLVPAPKSPGTDAPTRVEGRGNLAAPPSAATRPDGVAAARVAGTADTTEQQPRSPWGTSPLPEAPASNRTLRMEPPASSPPTLYGSDTVVDPLTGATTAVPAPEPERTEMLLMVPPTPPGAQDPGATRTAVPLVEAPNLTPPPVVPSRSVPPPRSSFSRRSRALLASALLALTALALVVGLRSSGGNEHAPAAGADPAPNPAVALPARHAAPPDPVPPAVPPPAAVGAAAPAPSAGSVPREPTAPPAFSSAAGAASPASSAAPAAPRTGAPSAGVAESPAVSALSAPRRLSGAAPAAVVATRSAPAPASTARPPRPPASVRAASRGSAVAPSPAAAPRPMPASGL